MTDDAQLAEDGRSHERNPRYPFAREMAQTCHLFGLLFFAGAAYVAVYVLSRTVPDMMFPLPNPFHVIGGPIGWAIVIPGDVAGTVAGLAATIGVLAVKIVREPEVITDVWL